MVWSCLITKRCPQCVGFSHAILIFLWEATVIGSPFSPRPLQLLRSCNKSPPYSFTRTSGQPKFGWIGISGSICGKPYEKPMFNGICWDFMVVSWDLMVWSPLFFVSYTSVDPHRWTPGNPLLFAVGWVVSTPQRSSGGITIPKWNWTSNTYLKPATNTNQVISCIRAVAVYHLHKLWAANLFCYCDRSVPIGAWRPASAGLPTRLGVYMLLFHQSKIVSPIMSETHLPDLTLPLPCSSPTTPNFAEKSMRG